ncbi:signal peptidase I [Kitasatospora viridis]|uniref:Signal peptidase I n=1 Tax=Kitasatospora viridis TaxID=281105 RepID=A0A561UED7_9ACTN|nr:signal peptidase I [Kitasatospora viridis]TWF97724.1 signal peptidase I [Kitasatospora viridis]
MSSLAEGATGTGAADRPAVAARRLGGVLQGVALALGLLLLVGGFAGIAVLYRPYAVPTGSMEPGILAGDTVLGRTVSGSTVGRGDVVVFQDPVWGNETLVKRVVAVGGDTVAGDVRGGITVNGTRIAEPYLEPAGPAPAGDAFSVTVPAGRLFVLGDNRTGSLDSRVHLDQDLGTVPDSAVKARVEATVWPFARFGPHHPTDAFAALGRPTAGRPGPLEPLFWACVGGAALIVLTSLTGPVAALGRRLRGSR